MPSISQDEKINFAPFIFSLALSNGKVTKILLACLLIAATNNTFSQSLELWEIQGNGNESPYEGQDVLTEGNVVTAKGSGFFFIQSTAANTDNDPATSDALIVYAAYFGQIGAIVNISGRVVENDGNTGIGGSSVTVDIAGTSAPLPEPIELDENHPSSSPSSPHSLERTENMRVQFSATAIAPSNGIEQVALTTANERPFREPGILYPGLNGLPVWDGNPEIFWFDPNGLNQPNNRFVNAGDLIDASGILMEADEGHWLVLPDAYTYTSVNTPEPVRAPEAEEFTVGSFNVLHLFSYDDAIDTKLRKLALYIKEQMQLPDILAVQEVGSLGVLQDLAYYIELMLPGTQYQAYLQYGPDDINLGFLVKPTIQDITITQLGASEPFTLGGLLHDRPPLLLQGYLPTEPPTLIQVLNIHSRSLIGIEGSSSNFVRNKRHQQAISIANKIEELRPAGNLLVLGDMNAYQFTDGYVDVVSQMSGQPSLGASINPIAIVSPPLQLHILDLPPSERYSYVFEGNAQALDHCLVSELDALQLNGMQYARGNADFALDYDANPNISTRSSDHDGLVVYLEALNPILEATTLPLSQNDITLSYPNPCQPGDWIQIRSENERLRSLQWYDMWGRLVMEEELGGQKAVEVQVPKVLMKGQTYLLKAKGNHSAQSGLIIIL